MERVERLAYVDKQRKEADTQARSKHYYSQVGPADLVAGSAVHLLCCMPGLMALPLPYPAKIMHATTHQMAWSQKRSSVSRQPCLTAPCLPPCPAVHLPAAHQPALPRHGAAHPP